MMVQYNFFIERERNHLTRFFELFQDKQEITVNEIKKVIARSSYYGIVLKKIYEINEIISEMEPGVELFKQTLSKDEHGKVRQSIRKDPRVNIKLLPRFVIISFEVVR